MNILGAKEWIWINGICLIIIGAISLVPEIATAIPAIPLSIVKIAVSVITLLVAFKETSVEMVNAKIWLVMVGVILLAMGVFPFFPTAMGAIPGIGDFLNTFKVVLGAVTFLLIIVDKDNLGPWTKNFQEE